MKSIRLSLIVYFFLLIALTLGAILGLLFQTTHKTLRDKEQSTRLVLKAQANIRRQNVEKDFDTRLLHRAQTLAGLVQIQWVRRPRECYTLGVLTAALAPAAYVQIPTWVAEGTDGPLGDRLERQSFVRVELPPAEAQRYDEESDGNYFEISNERGTRLQHSPSLGTRALPLTAEMLSQTAVYEWRSRETQLSASVPVRVVTGRVPVLRLRFLRGPVALRPPFPHRQGPPSRSVSTPMVFVQCASDTAPRDAEITSIDQDLRRELAALESESSATLAGLQRRLAWIGAAALATAVFGCCWLVGLGLAPLRRLSDAVSHVSEKDFRLPFDPSRLPIELRPIYERLRRTLEQLGRAFTRERQAAADISHELRTPLAALMTTIEVALRKPRNPDRYRECLAECRAIGQQMAQMVERLLALARLDAGTDQLQTLQVDAADVAEQSVALVRPLAEARGLELKLARNGAALLTTDPDKLREVLVNLLHNAVEYNRPRGRIEVRVAREDGHVELDVRDTGIGIATEARELIFERFYRADSSRQADTIHAGIGLSIVKGYVDLMGGRVWVDSAPGEGSIFHVRLPIGRAAP